MADTSSTTEPPLSPCIGTCKIDADKQCTGCARTLAEIAAWSTMDNSERKRIMEQVLPQRRKESR